MNLIKEVSKEWYGLNHTISKLTSFLYECFLKSHFRVKIATERGD